jgi:hypothetical protein
MDGPEYTGEDGACVQDTPINAIENLEKYQLDRASKSPKKALFLKEQECVFQLKKDEGLAFKGDAYATLMARKEERHRAQPTPLSTKAKLPSISGPPPTTECSLKRSWDSQSITRRFLTASLT